MRTKSALVFGLTLTLCATVAHAQPGAKKKPAAPRPPAEAAEPLRFPLSNQGPHYFGKIESVGKDGAVQLGPSAEMAAMPPAMRAELTEGWFLGIAQEVLSPQLADARLVRVLVTDVGEKRAVRAQVGKAAAESLKAGEFLILFRPRGATTARLKQVPDLAPLEEGPAPGKKKDELDTLQLTRSFNNLKQIGLAMHNFHDVYRHLPPAGINGPDNKPWHSWRVLILPFIDQAPLYNQYKFDEPWDGPNNKKLLARMPPQYSDPIHGDNKDFYTHYAAITGDDMAFTAEGADFDGINAGPAMGGGRGMAQFTDGTSNTLLVGPVGPDRKIPWMKPEDIHVDDKFPDLGKKGGFAVPYKTEKGNAAPFVRCDGSAVALLDSIDRNTFRALLTLDGGEPIGAYPSLNPTPQAGQMLPVIYVITEGDKTTARMAREPNLEDPLEMQFPGAIRPPQVDRAVRLPVPAPAAPRPDIKKAPNF